MSTTTSSPYANRTAPVSPATKPQRMSREVSPMHASDPELATATVNNTSYVAPPIPSSFKTSLIAWWKANHVEDAAHAELHLYRKSGYFEGATVNNAVCQNEDDFRNGKGLTQGMASAGVAQTTVAQSSSHSFWPFRSHKEPASMTVGTIPAADGKVGCIRLVDIGGASEDPQQPQQLKADETRDGVKLYVPPSGRKLNMLEIGLPYSEQNKDKIASETKIVLAHGYGAGAAFFYQNLNMMAQVPNSRLYALDWLGMGRSSRPTFHIPSAELKTTDTRVEAAESFFVSSLEDWRRKMGLEKMVLVGHSLGGYLSVAYALKYPQRVERLVLVSPVGIPNAPPEDPVSAKAAVDKEVNQPQTEVAPSAKQEQRDAQTMNRVVSGQTAGLDRTDTVDSAKIPRSGQAAVAEKGSHEAPRYSKRARSIFAHLWEQNVSPFGILRTSLFFGPMLAGRYTSRRFKALPDDELRALHAYCQSIFLSKGSGEYCLAHILMPGAYARKPMVERMGSLRMPVSFLYGEQDWMDVRGGREAVKRLRKAGNSSARCFVVPHSGHHIYLDNPGGFEGVMKPLLGDPSP